MRIATALIQLPMQPTERWLLPSEHSEPPVEPMQIGVAHRGVRGVAAVAAAPACEARASLRRLPQRRASCRTARWRSHRQRHTCSHTALQVVSVRAGNTMTAVTAAQLMARRQTTVTVEPAWYLALLQRLLVYAPPLLRVMLPSLLCAQNALNSEAKSQPSRCGLGADMCRTICLEYAWYAQRLAHLSHCRPS